MTDKPRIQVQMSKAQHKMLLLFALQHDTDVSKLVRKLLAEHLKKYGLDFERAGD